jgi:hypothetical protein
VLAEKPFINNYSNATTLACSGIPQEGHRSPQQRSIYRFDANSGI